MRDTKDDSKHGICGLCQKPFSAGEAVVQVIEDRHPAYDREIVLHTYHKVCCDNRWTLTHECPECGWWFHLSLLRTRAKYENPTGQLFCPFCAAPYEGRIGP